MRYLKVRVKQHPKGVIWARQHGQPTMIYPNGYSQIEFKYTGYIEENGITYVLGAVEDNDSGLVEVLKDKEVVTELTKEEAIAFSEKNQQRIERITDEGKIRRLEIKSRFGKPLTLNEEKALDPNDPTPGLNLSKILSDKFKKL